MTSDDRTLRLPKGEFLLLPTNKIQYTLKDPALNPEVFEKLYGFNPEDIKVSGKRVEWHEYLEVEEVDLEEFEKFVTACEIDEDAFAFMSKKEVSFTTYYFNLRNMNYQEVVEYAMKTLKIYNSILELEKLNKIEVHFSNIEIDLIARRGTRVGLNLEARYIGD